MEGVWDHHMVASEILVTPKERPIVLGSSTTITRQSLQIGTHRVKPTAESVGPMTSRLNSLVVLCWRWSVPSHLTDLGGTIREAASEFAKAFSIAFSIAFRSSFEGSGFQLQRETLVSRLHLALEYRAHLICQRVLVQQ